MDLQELYPPDYKGVFREREREMRGREGSYTNPQLHCNQQQQPTTNANRNYNKKKQNIKMLLKRISGLVMGCSFKTLLHISQSIFPPPLVNFRERKRGGRSLWMWEGLKSVHMTDTCRWLQYGWPSPSNPCETGSVFLLHRAFEKEVQVPKSKFHFFI